MIRLQAFTEAGSFNRRQTMMNVMEKMNVVSESFPQSFEKLRYMEKIFFGQPCIFRRQSVLGRFVKETFGGNSIRKGKAGNSGLNANRVISHADIFPNLITSFFNVAPVGMPIDEHRAAALAAQ